MSAPLTAAELHAIEQRSERATPAPWYVQGGPFWLGAYRHIRWGQLKVASVPDSSRQDEDAEFIAHERGDVSRLLATVRALRRLLEDHGGEEEDMVRVWMCRRCKKEIVVKPKPLNRAALSAAPVR